MSEKKTNILLVEDEESHAALIFRSFESATTPVSLTLARNLNEVRTCISKNVPDLIIADYLLEDGKGTELIPANKEDLPYPIVIMTSHGDEEIAVCAMKAGAFDYIVKSEAVLNDMFSICERILLEWNYNVRHKVIEQELKESEARFRGILSSLYESAVVIYDRDGKIVELWGTPEMDRRYGISAVDAVGRSIKDFLPPDQAERRVTGIQRVFDAGECMIVESMAIFPNGNFWNETSLSPMRDANGNITAVVGFIRDITENKQTEEALRESEKKIRIWLDNSPACTKIIDLDFNLQFMSSAGLKGLKIDDATQLYGKPYPFDFYPETFRSCMTRNMEKAKETGMVVEQEGSVISMEGDELWFHSTIVPVNDDKGRVDYLMVVSTDITERKKMEETILQSEKLKSLGTITAGVAHEFNNILAVTIGNAELLMGGFKDEQELKKGLRTIIESGEDGAGIVKRMLTFAKAELSESEFTNIDLQRLIKQAIEFTMPRWKNMAQAEDIKYNISTVGITETPEVFCNPIEMREVFINLIYNALDAMPDGGTITVATRCIHQSDELAWGREENASESKEDFVEITFADTGKGMSEDVQKKIFDPFFTTRRPLGTGLGMSITYSIMKRHGGKIGVESETGKGTTFNLCIPIRKGVVQKGDLSEPVREGTTKKLRILVADDAKEICMILDKFLSRAGHIVKTVNGGRDAIELSRREEFDLVICDLSMPEVTGYDVINALNGLDKRPRIGIATGWGEKIKPMENANLNVDFIIKKPFNLAELERKIGDLKI